MLFRRLPPSLQGRATLALSIMLVLLVLRSASVGLITWMGQHDPAALNTLGALHADLNRLGMRLEREPGMETGPALAMMQRHVDNPRLREAMTRPGRGAEADGYFTLQRHWQHALRPALERGDAAAFQREAAVLGLLLERLALGLQDDHERLSDLDMYGQLAALVIGATLMLLILYGLRRHAVVPLHELLEATDQLRNGRHDVRVSYQAPDEFGRLAQAFNAMAGDIQSSQRNLEERMDNELRNLAQANAALALFCSSSRAIAHSETNAAEIDQLLQRFQSVLPGLQLTLCLHPVNERPTGNVISFQGNGNRQVCSHFDCANCKHFNAVNQRIFVVRSQGQVLGELRATFGQGLPPGEWESMLTQALADLIGNALQLGRQREKDNFLLLHNERNTIARELHDSLAQSLSYLKLQVVRLQMLIERKEDIGQVREVSDALGDGLNDAYRQLRELLTTFRLSLSDGDLMNAMKVAVEEFSRRGGFRIFLQNDELPVPLAATEEIHLLQILRESLSNCCRHAGASQVWVQLRQAGEDVELIVEDDGRGFAAPDAEQQHHGLTIMNERARSICGTLEIGPRQPRGTRVHLRFRPRFLAEQLREMAV
ncbi:MAG TPA: histidine kinase [Moraxellaceae bacterium]|nr:histidine kinase [Moraxellaceae bacterium]